MARLRPPARLTGKILRNEPAPASPAPGRPGESGAGPADTGGGPAGGAGGFGLAAMRQRIEGLSGTLQVESENRGAAWCYLLSKETPPGRSQNG